MTRKDPTPDHHTPLPTWPLAELGEAIEALARHSHFPVQPAEIPRPPQTLLTEGPEQLGRWVEVTAACLGLEAEPVNTSYSEVENFILNSGPALCRLPAGGPGDPSPRFLLLLGRRGRRVLLLGPDLTRRAVEPEAVTPLLCQDLEGSLIAGIDRLLDKAGVSSARRPKARAALLAERLAGAWVGNCWLLRVPPGAGFWRQLRLSGWPRSLGALLTIHTAQYALWLLAWWLIGRGVLQGRLDPGWLVAWSLALLTIVPLRLWTTWLQGLLVVNAGSLLKRRLLYGAMRLEPDEIRHQGAGHFLGQVLESETVESLALSGGFLGLMALLEIGLAAFVLWAGAAGPLSLLLLLVWLGVTFLAGRWYWRERRRWTDLRLDMTHDLVEQMVGYRTRLAQQPAGQWHRAEDQALERYQGLSRWLDRAAAVNLALVPRGWLLVSLAGLAPAFVGGLAGQAALAISLGGVLSVYFSLRKLTLGLTHLAGAAVAWERSRPIFQAAGRPEESGQPEFAPARLSEIATAPAPLLDAQEVGYHYLSRTEAVLQGVNLRINSGDRLLLQGPSGGGKSTLAALLTGLRQPASGLLLLGGLDRPTLGTAGWRRGVVAAPQFQENHVLTGTLAFNLLMGKRWPPLREDMQEAEAICRELGLGGLLQRMPAGLLQIVGETGWQLSHGERSRLYIARAILQGAEIVILDESFAALDPANLEIALNCVLRRTSTLLLIAHP